MGTYEFEGEQYRQASRHQKEWGSRLIAQLALRGTERILDLGCGDGVLTQRLASLVPAGSVLGIDASAGMLEAARGCAGENLRFEQMDINELAFENEFDVLYSNAALHWVKDHERLLKNCLRALKPGGVILWNFAGDGTCTYFYGVMRQMMGERRYGGFFQGFEWPWYMPSKQAYEALIGQAGFSEYAVAEENADRFFADADEMIRWLDQPSLVPFLACLPAPEKEAFRDEAVARMLQRTRQPDGTCFETFRRIRVRAVK